MVPAKPRGAKTRMDTVGQWDRFEASAANPRTYADAYNDVVLDVTYTRPDGSTADFPGFYDGGQTWKFRFMPDQVGTWRYEARFTDGAAGLSGSFECVASPIPGMIAVDEANPLWFGFKGGGHGLIRSLHVGDRFFAANWSGEQRTAFLDWAQGQGYNMLSIASHYLNREQDARGRGWQTPRLWPLDAQQYRRLEGILDELASRRIAVYPFAGFFGRASKCPASPADRTRFLRYTLARLGSYWNILLNVGGPEPNLDDYLSPGEVNRLGAEIRSLDVFGHPLAVHNKTGSGDPYRDSTWSSYSIIQGPKTLDRAVLSRELLENHHDAKPLYVQETLWPGNQYHRCDYTDEDIRKNAIVIQMSAGALNFGDFDGDSSSGFSGSLDLADKVQSRHDSVRAVWDYFASIAFYRMRPRQDLVSTGYCLAEVGKEYLVYLESGGTVNVTLAHGTYASEWINAQKTADRRPGPLTRDGQQLTAPEDGDDWLLHLVAQGGNP